MDLRQHHEHSDIACAIREIQPTMNRQDINEPTNKNKPIELLSESGGCSCGFTAMIKFTGLD